MKPSEIFNLEPPQHMRWSMRLLSRKTLEDHKTFKMIAWKLPIWESSLQWLPLKMLTFYSRKHPLSCKRKEKEGHQRRTSTSSWRSRKRSMACLRPNNLLLKCAAASGLQIGKLLGIKCIRTWFRPPLTPCSPSKIWYEVLRPWLINKLPPKFKERTLIFNSPY